MTKFNIFINIIGFNYSGIKIHIISLLIFILFSIIPIDKIIKDDINFINQISKFTSGIYYLHLPMISYLESYIVLIRKRRIYGTIIIYIICYLICFIGDLLLGKTKLMHLFK